MKSSFVRNVIWLFCCAACHGQSRGGGQAGDLSQIDAILRGVNQSARSRDQILGPHRRTAHGTIKMSVLQVPQRQETLDENYFLDVGPAGQLHVVHELNAQDGMEAIFVPPDLYVRPRYGKFVKRAPEEGELERLRGLIESNLGDYLALAKQARLNVETANDPAQGAKTQLTLVSDSNQKEGSEKNSDWRARVAIQKLDASLAWRGATPVLAGGHLGLVYTFERAPEGSCKVEVDYTEKLEAVQPIVAPVEWVTLTRPRPMVDRETLLAPLRK